MQKKILFIIFTSVFLAACTSDNSMNETSVETIDKEEKNTNLSKEKKEDPSSIELKEGAERLAKEEKFDELETYIEDNSTSFSDKNFNAAKSYIAFQNSDESMSVKTGKLMDEVEFGYVGILENEIEAAIYSPHEEDSLLSELGALGFDDLDWKYNDTKDAYEKAKSYKEIIARIEIEKEEKGTQIETVEEINPYIGMTKEEAEASQWSKSVKVNRRVTQFGTKEQWVYGNRQYLYFTDGILTGFQD